MSGRLPVANPTVAFWQTSPHILASHRSSETVPEECDIAIVGTGLAGVATAYHILSKMDGSPKPKIVLFEARQACSGATGRNVEKENIDCDLFVTRSLQIYFDPENARAIKVWVDENRHAGAFWTRDVQWLEGPHLELVTGVKGAAAALSVPALSLWPYKFVTALLARVLDLGALLYTETPIEAVNLEEGGSVSLRTPRGTTRAKKVIYATNGYSSAILPQYEGVIVPIKGQASHLVPNASHRMANLSHTYNLAYYGQTVDYLVPRPDGSIILGGGSRVFRKDLKDRHPKWFDNVDDSTLIDDGVKAEFDTTMARYFRGWEDSEAKVDEMWTGIMGSTPDGLPHVGSVPGTDNQWILAGFNGGGMTMIFTTAEEIADMVLNGTMLEQTKIPRLFKSTTERLSVKF